MSLWGAANNAGSAPKFRLGGLGLVANTDPLSAANRLITGNLTFANVRAGAFKSNLVVGTISVSAAEKANTGNTTPGEGPKPQHAGWNLRKAGMGPVATVTITSGGTGYAPGGGYITLTGGGPGGVGLGNTTANLFFQANAGGSLVNVSINVAGSYATAPTVNVGGSSGTPANVTLTMGGRANRVQYETLVASGSLASNSVTAARVLFPS